MAPSLSIGATSGAGRGRIRVDDARDRLGGPGMKWRAIEPARGVHCRVLEGGGGAPLVFLHGAAGLLRDNPFLDALARQYHVFAPELPGFGESTGEDLLEDML